LSFYGLKVHDIYSIFRQKLRHSSKRPDNMRFSTVPKKIICRKTL